MESLYTNVKIQKQQLAVNKLYERLFSLFELIQQKALQSILKQAKFV